MTAEQKKQVDAYRQNGKGFVEIAQTMGLPITTVKSYCYRHPLKEALPLITSKCPQCGSELQPSRFRPRRFCSDECRRNYWRSHTSEMNQRMIVRCTCAFCGADFQDYPQRERKYCSHDCYIAARYGGDRHE